MALAAIAVQAQEKVLILSSLDYRSPWQARVQQAILERFEQSRLHGDPNAQQVSLFFESVDVTFRNLSLEARADIVAKRFDDTLIDQVVVIGQPASAAYELIADRLGNPSVEYVDTPWQSAYGLDADSLRQPEAIYNSLRDLVPELTRLVYMGRDGVAFEDFVLFDDRRSIEFEAHSRFGSHQQFDAVKKSLKAGDAVLVDRSAIVIGSEVLLPFQTARKLVEQSAAPVFVAPINAVEIDGVVGGLVTDPSELGRAVFDLIQGNTPDSRINKHIYNYEALKRFGLNVSAIKAPVEIRGQTYLSMTLEQVQGYAAIGGVCFGAFLFVWLARERRRSKKIAAVSNENAQLYRSLQQRQRSSEVALDAAGIAYYQYNHRNAELSTDERFLRLYGLSDEQPVNLYALKDQIHPDDVDTVVEFRSRAYSGCIDDAGETDYSVVYRIYHKQTGELVWLKAFARQFVVDGELLTLGCIFSVDAEMQAKEMLEEASASAQQALKELQITAEQGGIGLLRHDLKTDIFEVNSIFRKLFDFPESEYPVVSFDDYCTRLPAKDRDVLVAEAISARHNREITHQQAKFVRRDGSEIWVKVGLKSRLIAGKPVEVVGSFVDITQIRKLSDELEQLAKERQVALEALERRQQAQQQMFAVIGHELRTPAAALSMMLDSQREALANDEIETLPYARDINATAKHLMDVLDDLRAVVEPESINFRSYDNAIPLDVIEGCLMLLRDRLKTANLWVQLNSVQGAAEPFSFDTKGLRQIITNLVKNAAVHSGASELKLGLALKLNDQGQQQLRVELADNGKGIPEEQWESIFEPFERGDTEADGTGLGLHICREIARASGGELLLNGSPDGGCRFTLVMPLEEVVEEPESKPISLDVADSLSGKSILFAEDNLTLRMLTEQILKGLDVQYKPAINGAEALALAAEQDFDLVLTDIFMPEVDGFEMVETLRKRGFSKPIIGITAAMVGDETDRLLAVGADIVVPKPVTRDKLEAAWLEIQEARQSEA